MSEADSWQASFALGFKNYSKLLLDNFPVTPYDIGNLAK
jgi:hypothetical protein